MEKLFDLIQDYKANNLDTFVDIVEKFDPLLNKYQRNSCCEDIKYDLILFMSILLDKIPLENELFKQEKYIISYIHRSLKNQYILLNKTQSKVCRSEIPLDDKFMEYSHENFNSDIIFYDMISTLTKLEKKIIMEIYMFDSTESEVARIQNVSRQAIHKTHKNALRKLRKIYS